jgi:hypothetical protein
MLNNYTAQRTLAYNLAQQALANVNIQNEYATKQLMLAHIAYFNHPVKVDYKKFLEHQIGKVRKLLEALY